MTVSWQQAKYFRHWNGCTGCLQSILTGSGWQEIHQINNIEEILAATKIEPDDFIHWLQHQDRIRDQKDIFGGKKILITDWVVSTKHSILTMSATAAKEILNTAANFKLKRGRKRILILRKGDGKLCREREAREGDLVREGGREWKRSGKRVER